jgi:hypothetical protein
MYQETSSSPTAQTANFKALPTTTRTTTVAPQTFHKPHFNESNADNSTIAARLAERERIRMEFFATYDVMTGIRIAATLGGFFVLMVFLVIYKSRSHTNKGLDVS